MDEVYSLAMASSDLPRLADLAVQDLHPPLYYLALHAWLAGLDSLSLPRSIHSARALNLAIWTVLVLATWRSLSAALGRTLGSLSALLVGSSAHIVQFTQDARSYGFAAAGIAICGFLIVQDLLDEAPAMRKKIVRAFAYTLSACVAAWSHLLSWLLLVLLGAMWLFLSWRLLRAHHRAWYGLPVAASGATALLASPWLPVALERTSALQSAAPQWMTPASFFNLSRVFWDWLPFGRDGLPWMVFPRGLALATGVLSLVPFVLLLLPVPRSRGSEQPSRQRRVRWLAVGLAAISLAFVAVLWGASRLSWLALFHGPRYPCLVVALWTTSLLLAAAQFSGFERRPILAIVPLAPWLLSSGAALFHSAKLPVQSLGAEFRATATAIAQGDALPLFYLEEELAPYFRKTLASLGSRPATELPCALLGSDALLVGLNRWRELDRPESLRVHGAIAQGLVLRLDRRLIPAEHPSFEISRLSAGAPVSPVLRGWCEGKDPLSLAQAARRGAVVAAPQDQRYRDGWSYLEFDRLLRPYRWTRLPEAVLRFSGEIRGGRYLVQLRGASPALGDRERRLRVRTTTRATLFDAPVSPGAFELTFELALPPGRRNSWALLLEHEVISVTEGTAPGDSYRRTIGMLLREATLQPL